MKNKRQQEGEVILIISLSSIVLWLIISTSNAPVIVGFYDDFIYYMNIDAHLFCETYGGGMIGGMKLPDTIECSLNFTVKTKTAVLFSFLCVVYGLLVYLSHVPGLKEIWDKFRAPPKPEAKRDGVKRMGSQKDE